MNSARLARLDAIRALGVLLVIGHHAAFRFVPAETDFIGLMLRYIGWTGVDLFFALSGFLVVGILAKEKNRADLPLYFRKRFFRIVPIMMVAIATYGDIELWRGGDIAPLIGPVFFLTGYLYPFYGDAVPYTITWSLSVEVTAYIVLAIVAARAWRWFPAFLIGLIIVCPIVRLWLAYGEGWEHLAVTFFPPVRLDSIAWGGIAALGLLDRCYLGRFARVLYGVLTIGVIVGFAYVDANVVVTFGLTLLGIFGALWVRALSLKEADASPGMLGLASIGLVSYFMYLFHLFVIEALLLVDQRIEAIALNYWAALILGSAITYGAALISWRIIEEPLIRLSGKRSARPVSLVP